MTLDDSERYGCVVYQCIRTAEFILLRVFLAVLCCSMLKTYIRVGLVCMVMDM